MITVRKFSLMTASLSVSSAPTCAHTFCLPRRVARRPLEPSFSPPIELVTAREKNSFSLEKGSNSTSSASCQSRVDLDALDDYERWNRDSKTTASQTILSRYRVDSERVPLRMQDQIKRSLIDPFTSLSFPPLAHTFDNLTFPHRFTRVDPRKK